MQEKIRHQRIGIMGPAGAGKDTVADLICELAPQFQKLSFAAPLYAEVARSFGVSEGFLRNRKCKESKAITLRLGHSDNPEFIAVCESLGISKNTMLSPREALEFWGTDYRRRQDPDYWVKRHEEKATQFSVAPDVRFENEAEPMDLLIRVRRPGFEVMRDGVESDRLWREVECDFEVCNDGDVNKLRSGISLIIKEGFLKWTASIV